MTDRQRAAWKSWLRRIRLSRIKLDCTEYDMDRVSN